MNHVILKRFGRGIGAVVLGFVASFIVGDDVLGLVPDAYDPLVITVVAPALLALEKFLRDGGASDDKTTSRKVVGTFPAVFIPPAPDDAVPSLTSYTLPPDEPVAYNPDWSDRKKAGMATAALTLDGQPKRQLDEQPKGQS